MVGQAVYSPPPSLSSPILLPSSNLSPPVQHGRQVVLSDPGHGEKVEDPGGGGHFGYWAENKAMAEVPDISPPELGLQVTGPPAELLDMFGISTDNIVRAVNDVVKL